jgi:hypothetical protein
MRLCTTEGLASMQARVGMKGGTGAAAHFAAQVFAITLEFGPLIACGD